MIKFTTTERDARNQLTIEASYQIEALSDMILDRFEEVETDGLKSAVIRMRDLSSAIMAAMNDDGETTADLHRIVHGRHLPCVLRAGEEAGGAT